MPFYEYQCQACGEQVEALQKISDPPLKKCPACGKSRLTRLISAPVFRLKGGGWYETDFKTDKDNKRNLVESDKGDAKSDTKPEAKADATKETKAEAKPEAKAEPKESSKSAAKPAAKAVKKAPARATTKRKKAKR
jgi:putative FmdB family regulatory protein